MNLSLSTMKSSLILAGAAALLALLLTSPAGVGAAVNLDGGGGGGGGSYQCDDGWDNDGNGLTDYYEDPGCASSLDNIEAGYTPQPTQCNDGVDNDSNGFIDMGDPGCTSTGDTSESGYVPTQCNDNIDNDLNGLKDYPADLGCTSGADTTEAGYVPPQCADTLDNDLDGKKDLLDTGCTSSADTTEHPNPQCSDGVDNDLNDRTDYPADLGCSSVSDNQESGYTPPAVPGSGIIVYSTQSKRDYYPKVKPDMLANGGIDETAAHAYPNYGSPTSSGNRICYLYDPTAYPTSWSTGGFDSPSGDYMAAWNVAQGKWIRASANSFGNSRYNYITCKTSAPPDTSLTASATGIPAASSITVVAGTPVTLTWYSQYGQLRQGTFTATNYSLTTFIPGHYQDVTTLVCEPDYCGGDIYCAQASNDNRSQLAAVQWGTCWYEYSTEWVPDQTIARPYGGSTTVSPATTTVYTYRGTNSNGSNTSTVTVNVNALTQCNDGLDNNGNGQIDMADPGCTDPTDPTESTQCADGINNDGDAWTDLADPGCTGPTDTTESPNPQCSDGVDNDGGGDTDYPADLGCSGITDTTESPNPPVPPTANLSGPASVITGNNATLTWSSTNATSCTGTGFNTGGATSGSLSVGPLSNPPQASYGYQISCSGAANPPASDTHTVNVVVPTVDISVSPDRVTAGGSVNVSWTSSQATSCTVSGTNGFASSGLTGTNVSSGPINTQTTFTVTCDGAAATDYAIVNVVPFFEET